MKINTKSFNPPAFTWMPLIILTAILGRPTSGHAQMSRMEKKIVAAVDDFTADNLRLWEESVNINSGSLNFDGVYKVGQLYKPKFEALGFTTRWVDGKTFGRAGHLVAEHMGNGTG